MLMVLRMQQCPAAPAVGDCSRASPHLGSLTLTAGLPSKPGSRCPNLKCHSAAVTRDGIQSLVVLCAALAGGRRRHQGTHPHAGAHDHGGSARSHAGQSAGGGGGCAGKACCCVCSRVLFRQGRLVGGGACAGGQVEAEEHSTGMQCLHQTEKLVLVLEQCVSCPKWCWLCQAEGECRRKRSSSHRAPADHGCLQRLLLASLNGLAGLLLLQELPADAVRTYREALATSEWSWLVAAAEQLWSGHQALWFSSAMHLLDNHPALASGCVVV